MGKLLTLTEADQKTRLEVLGTKSRLSEKWKRRNDPVMTPDRGFVKQLKTLDKELEVVWDWGSARWEIWKFPELGKPYLITRVQAEGRTYRELGQDVLINLQMHIQLGPKRILDYLEEHNNQLRRRRAEEFQEKIRAIADDAWGPLFTIYTQVPKAYNIEKPLINKVAEVI